MHVSRLGIMLRLHRRPDHLKNIFANFSKLARKRELYLNVQLDRPLPSVCAQLDKVLSTAPSGWDISVDDAPFALVDAAGEHYMAALAIQYERLLAQGPIQAAALWDDDMWLDRGGVREVCGHLDILEYDAYRARSHFLWDSESTYNAAFPLHWQDLFWRVIRGDKYPKDWMTHSPEQAAKGSKLDLQNPLLNAGYLHEDDRKLGFATAKRAGKLDNHTFALIQEPTLRPV